MRSPAHSLVLWPLAHCTQPTPTTVHHSLARGCKMVSAANGKGKASAPGIKKVKGENFYRDAKGAKRVKLLSKDGIASKGIRDRKGNLVKAAEFQSSEATPGRVQPDRRWFGNTRVISQDALSHFREALGSRVNDPYSVLLRRNKLPMSLITDQQPSRTTEGIGGSRLTEVESFSDTFGPSARRKRPRLDPGAVGSFADFAASGATAVEDSENKVAEQEAKDRGAHLVSEDREIPILPAEENPYEIPVERGRSQPAYSKGQSRRIWAELYKVIDSSDVVIHVLDARDPEGTRCRTVEKHIREEKPHKHLVFLLNKVDLVPTWVTARWVKHLSHTAPTLAFHASINNSFGKGSLISLLRQFSRLHSDKKQISIGFVGYPNAGKSSIINTLKAKKVCTVAPVPGETKVWQYISLMKRIYLVDCPGIVPVGMKDTETATVLKGVVRVENLETPAEHIPTLLTRVEPVHLQKTYGLSKWTSAGDFLSQLAKKMGKLVKGGEPDHQAAAKIVLNDWIRGRIPFFVPPPGYEPGTSTKMSTRAAKADLLNVPNVSAKDATQALASRKANEQKEDKFTNFDSEEAQASAKDGHEEDEEDGARQKQDDDDESGGDEEVSDEESSDEDDSLEQLGWADVFGGDQQGPSGAARVEGEDGEDEEDEEDPDLVIGEDDDDDDEDHDDEDDDDQEEGSASGRGKGAERDQASDQEGDDAETPSDDAGSSASPGPDRPAGKEKRMTTSKRKKENYYTHANVKNKNRARASHNVELARSAKVARPKRVGVNGRAARTQKNKKRR